MTIMVGQPQLTGANVHTNVTGLERDHTKAFADIRRKNVDRTFLEISRLEKRLTRLTQLLASPPEQNASTGGLLWPLSPIKTQRKELEQSVVSWEDDASVSRCPFCQQEFSNYSFRRHHCRTCGRVVCGDLRTGCSGELALDVAIGMLCLEGISFASNRPAANSKTEKGTDEVSIDMRICKECKHTLFSRKDLTAELAHKPPDVRAYENLQQFERGIRLMLPKFQRLLGTLQYTEPTLVISWLTIQGSG